MFHEEDSKEQKADQTTLATIYYFPTLTGGHISIFYQGHYFSYHSYPPGAFKDDLKKGPEHNDPRRLMRLYSGRKIESDVILNGFIGTETANYKSRPIKLIVPISEVESFPEFKLADYHVITNNCAHLVETHLVHAKALAENSHAILPGDLFEKIKEETYWRFDRAIEESEKNVVSPEDVSGRKAFLLEVKSIIDNQDLTLAGKGLFSPKTPYGVQALRNLLSSIESMNEKEINEKFHKVLKVLVESIYVRDNRNRDPLVEKAYTNCLEIALGQKLIKLGPPRQYIPLHSRPRF